MRTLSATRNTSGHVDLTVEEFGRTTVLATIVDPTSDELQDLVFALDDILSDITDEEISEDEEAEEETCLS